MQLSVGDWEHRRNSHGRGETTALRTQRRTKPLTLPEGSLPGVPLLRSDSLLCVGRGLLLSRQPHCEQACRLHIWKEMSLQQLNPCEAEKENQGISSIYQGRHFSSHALAELERCVSVVLLLMETQPAKKTGKPKTRQPKGSVIYVISRLCCTTF